MGKNTMLLLILGITIIAACTQQQNIANEPVAKTTNKEVKYILRLGEVAKAPNGYGVKFTGLPFAECPSGLPKDVIAEVQGVQLTLLDKDGSILRDELRNSKIVVFCKGDVQIISDLGNIEVTVIDFKPTEYPTGKPEIPATVEIILRNS